MAHGVARSCSGYRPAQDTGCSDDGQRPNPGPILAQLHPWILAEILIDKHAATKGLALCQLDPTKGPARY